MAQVRLESESVRVRIIASLGAGVAELSFRAASGEWLPLLRTAPEPVTWFNDLAAYLLVPWSNRIAGGAFEWLGKIYNPEADWPDGAAIHGRVKDKPWRIVQRSPVSLLLAFSSTDHPQAGWPWAYDAEVLYVVGDGELRVGVRVAHRAGGGGADPMPVGVGFHPFWNRSLRGEPDDVNIRVPGGLRRYPCKGMIPVGSPAEDDVTRDLVDGRPLGALELDDVFLGSADGAEIAWTRAGVRVRYSCSSDLGHTVLFTGSAGSDGAMPGFFCLEPASMVNDGFNLISRGWADTGVRALRPGESMRAEWRVGVGSM